MIYLDSAATSMLKPDGVTYAVVEAMSNMGSPGRGAHEAAMKAAGLCYECRRNLADLFRMKDESRVVFTFNATHALNIAIASLVKPGTRVLVSGYEHNSVMRPLRAHGAKVEVIRSALFDQQAMLKAFALRLPKSDVAVFTYVSNVFGFILPVEEMARLCRKMNKPFLIDASQAAGVLPIAFDELGADFLACPGHKALLGPQGTGVLLCKKDAVPLLYGGSGSDSRLPLMPEYLPDRLEAGTHNVAGIAGLNAGVKYLLHQGLDKIQAREQEALELMVGELLGCEELNLFYSSDKNVQCAVLSILPRDHNCERLGEALAQADVAVRTGLQCAPSAHETAGTLDTGTVRLSFSPFNSRDELYAAAKMIKKFSKIS